MDKKQISNQNKIILCAAVCIIVPYAAAYASVPGKSLAASCCLLAFCAAICSAVFGPLALKLILPTAVTAMVFSLLAGPDESIAAAVIMLVMCAAFSFAYAAFKKKNNLVKALSALLAIAMFPLNAFFCGFITDALPAQSIINEYTSKRYQENSVISTVYYDIHSGAYKCDIFAADSPTEIKSISLKNGMITDTYLKFTEQKLMTKPALDITASLRNAFPNGSFSVDGAGIVGYPSEKTDPLSTEDISRLIEFTVHIGGMMSLDEFVCEAQKYADVLCFSDSEFYSVTLIGGNGQQDIYSVKIKKNYLSSRISKERITPVSRMKYYDSPLY